MPVSFGSPAESMPRKARILIVDDHAFLRQSLVILIDGQPDLACCGEADSASAVPGAVAGQNPDVVLLDLKLKDGEAFELINSLTLLFPRIAILVLSQYDETIYAQRVLREGARGYLMKESAPEDLLHAIRAVLAGKTYLSCAMSHLLFGLDQRHSGQTGLDGAG
jgi:DNA-binding NarL/FixJ family response regulator